MDGDFHLPAASYGPTLLLAAPPTRGAPLCTSDKSTKMGQIPLLSYHEILKTKIYSSSWNWQISPMMTLNWCNIKCKCTYSTKALGHCGDEDHSLVQASISLSSSVQIKIKSVLWSLSGQKCKTLLQEWSLTALQLSEHNGTGSTILSPKDGPKDDHEPLPYSLFESESGEGVKPLG